MTVRESGFLYILVLCIISATKYSVFESKKGLGKMMLLKQKAILFLLWYKHLAGLPPELLFFKAEKGFHLELCVEKG